LKAQALNTDTDGTGSITFAFGHVFGLGLQLALEGKSYEQILWQLYLQWKPDLEARDDKRSKNFYLACASIQNFITQIQPSLFKDWELVYYNGKPAVELSFIIILPGGFKYRGFVDAVLKHKHTGKVRVLETKTTWFGTEHVATYKNSAQAIGYSIVLDKLFENLSSYEVLYLIYQTTKREFIPLSFNKSYISRALWIQELMLDVQTIELYERTGIYPMHGESCNNFFHACEYLHNCTLSTVHLASPLTNKMVERIEKENSEYQITVTLEELIQVQLDRSKVDE